MNEKERLTQTEKTKLLNVLKRRIVERIPAPYITNQAIFGDYIFYVDSRSIIPRSRTTNFILKINHLVIAEVLVNDKLSPWLLKPAEKVSQCLDMCTGIYNCLYDSLTWKEMVH